MTRRTKDAARELKPNAAFLLSQVGAHSAEVFAKLLEPLRLAPAHSGILWMLGRSAGISQKALASTLKVHPSRLVGLLDELEGRGLIERRGHTSDRRLYALHLTPKGEATFERIIKITGEHVKQVCGGLTKAEGAQLTELLQKIAADRGLTRAVHPGYRWLGRKVRPKGS
jgi:DNA-binding MarR family transcriptional regulator